MDYLRRSARISWMDRVGNETIRTKNGNEERHITSFCLLQWLSLMHHLYVKNLYFQSLNCFFWIFINTEVNNPKLWKNLVFIYKFKISHTTRACNNFFLLLVLERGIICLKHNCEDPLSTEIVSWQGNNKIYCIFIKNIKFIIHIYSTNNEP
jgi:hypothetical protein